MDNKCKNVISLKQYGPTCWFNSILMAILYSDGSRKLLLEKSKKWDKNILIYKTLDYILKNKYLRTDNKYNDYLYFDTIRPEYILKELYKYNKNKFQFNPEKYNIYGYKSALYIRKIYKLLGVKVLLLDKIEDRIYYSKYNNVKLISIKKTGIVYEIKHKSLGNIIKKFNNPDIIIINLLSKYHKYPAYYNLENENFNTALEIELNTSNNKVYEEIKNLKDNILFNNEKYIQDSVLLTNWNINKGGHSISGITCNSNKYVYNGWTRSTIDPNIETNNIKIPCELMKYNWDLHKNNDFCLNSKKWGIKRLERAIQILMETDLRLRSSKLDPKSALMERALIKISMMVSK